jgi:fatty acid synthase
LPSGEKPAVEPGQEAPKLEQDVQKIPITEPRPVCYVYSGMGSQWPGMGRKLMVIPAFDRSIRESSAALDEYGLDVYKMLQSADPAYYENNTMNCMLAITAIQVYYFYFQ